MTTYFDWFDKAFGIRTGAFARPVVTVVSQSASPHKPGWCLLHPAHCIQLYIYTHCIQPTPSDFNPATLTPIALSNTRHPAALTPIASNRTDTTRIWFAGYAAAIADKGCAARDLNSTCHPRFFA